MPSIFVEYLPNLTVYWQEFLTSIKETLIMMGVAGIISFIFGLLFGIVLVVTKKGGILQNRLINFIIDKIVNIFRSIPFVIMLALIQPFSRLIVGTSIGLKGAMVPIVVGCIPFFIRQVDMALSDLDKGLIEAAQAIGASPLEIIYRVYLKESIPSLARSTTITLISLLGLTAMGGAVGGGGLGSFVIRYGYNRFMGDITIVSVIVILIIVSIIQFVGDFIVKKTTH
jgi:ABC-type metal ion transport system, permease component